jgi:hypothetical protein
MSVQYAARRSSEENISGGTSNPVSRPYTGLALIASPITNCKNPSDGKEKPYTCRRCRSKFARRDTMLRHIRNFHPDLQNPSHSVMDVDVPSPNSSPQSVNTDFTEASESQPGGEHSDISAGEGLMAVGSDHPLGPDGGFHGHANPQQVDEPSNMNASQDVRFSESVNNNYRPSDVESASVPARPDNFEAPQPDASNGAYLPEESLWFPDGESNIFDINDLATMFSPNMPLPTPGRHTSSIGFLGEQSEDFFFPAPHASQSMGFSEDEEYLHAVIATTDKTYNAANSPVVTDSEVSACVEMINLFSISKLPLSKNMINRYFKAYVQYFDPHTPIVHLATFKIDSAPGKLPQVWGGGFPANELRKSFTHIGDAHYWSSLC